MQNKRANLILLLSLVGMVCAGYLTYMHLGLMRGQLLGGFGCGGEGLLNCHAVTASRWGSLFGMPLSLWGIFAYSILVGLALLAKQSEHFAQKAWNVLAGLSLLFVLGDVFLLGIMLFEIKYLCAFCLGTYVLNVLILVIASQVAGNPLKALVRLPADIGVVFPNSSHPQSQFFWIIALFGALGAVGVHTSTIYVQRGSLTSMRPQIQEYLAQQQRVEVPRGDSPVKGDGSGKLEVIEFSDMLCPVCQKAAKMNTVMLANYRKDAVLVFKHYPLDNECNSSLHHAVHPGACRLAAASVCADKQGKFWEFHDHIFAGDDVFQVKNLDKAVTELGLDVAAHQACMQSGEGMRVVKKDVADGIRIGVQSTPTFVLNGYVVRGSLAPSTFDDFVTAIKGNP